MIATLILASAHLAAPASLEAVNFVHNYKQDDKSSYELHITSVTSDEEVFAEFELAIRSSPKNGKTKSVFTFTALEMNGEDMTSIAGAIDFDLSKHGVPTSLDMESVNNVLLIAFVALLTTDLPAESLNVGDSFKLNLLKSPDYKGSGKFEGMKKVDGVELAVLKSKGVLIIDDEDADLTVTTYYDPASKTVVMTSATIDLTDQGFDLELKRKKSK